MKMSEAESNASEKRTSSKPLSRPPSHLHPKFMPSIAPIEANTKSKGRTIQEHAMTKEIIDVRFHLLADE